MAKACRPLCRPWAAGLSIFVVVPESHTLLALALVPLVHDQPLLDPEQLSETTEASVDELLHQGQSANTLASYATAMRYWAGWYAARYGTRLVLPVPVAGGRPVHCGSRGARRALPCSGTTSWAMRSRARPRACSRTMTSRTHCHDISYTA